MQPSIFIHNIRLVNSTFHARFDAKKRLYRYVLYDGGYQPFWLIMRYMYNQLMLKNSMSMPKHLLDFIILSILKSLVVGQQKDERTIFKAGAYRHKNLIIVYF